MKFLIISILGITVFFVLLINLRISKIEKNDINSAFRFVANMGALTVLMYAAVVFVNEQNQALVLYSFYYSVMDAMLVSVLYFIRAYTQQSGFKKICIASIVVGALDICVQFANIFLKNLYNLRITDDSSGFFFYRVVERKPLFMLHIFFLFGIAALVEYILIRKMMKTTAVFRGKFLVMFVLFAVVSVAYLFFLFAKTKFDYSVVFYGSLIVTAFYLIYYYKPYRLIDNLLAFVVKNHDAAVLCYDIYGKFLYANEPAKKQIRELKGITNPDEYYTILLEEKKIEDVTELVWNEEFGSDDDKRILEFNFSKLYERKKIIGSYLFIYDKTEEIKKNEENHYRATHDCLTGVYNSGFFFKMVADYLKITDEPYYMVCTDIRNFKMINEIYGEEKSNEILIKIATALKQLLTGKEFCCRLRGDRFAICMPKRLYDEEYFKREIYRVGRTIGTSSPVHMYVGVYEITDRTMEVSVMCDRAGLAINSVKDSHEGRVVYYDDTMRKNVVNEQRVVSSFTDALQDGQFQIYLHPQVSADGKVQGAEALVRWLHPERGLIPPFEFIEIYERTGLISRLDEHVWDLACRQLAEWNEKGYKDTYLSVNISPKDFYYLNLYDVFTKMVDKYGLQPSQLHLEITETAVIADMDKQIALIEQLREYGFWVEMDDFGSGYSSLNMLTQLNVDTLKIDMGFLRRSGGSENSAVIIDSIIRLAKELGMHVITEGVETKEQLSMLIDMGCERFQGYYFAKPMQVSEYESKYMAKCS